MLWYFSLVRGYESLLKWEFGFVEDFRRSTVVKSLTGNQGRLGQRILL
jgi:hypothetical protein